jgi:hypothetical protein
MEECGRLQQFIDKKVTGRHTNYGDKVVIELKDDTLAWVEIPISSNDRCVDNMYAPPFLMKTTHCCLRFLKQKS